MRKFLLGFVSLLAIVTIIGCKQASEPTPGDVTSGTFYFNKGDDTFVVTIAGGSFKSTADLKTADFAFTGESGFNLKDATIIRASDTVVKFVSDFIYDDGVGTLTVKAAALASAAASVTVAGAVVDTPMPEGVITIDDAGTSPLTAKIVTPGALVKVNNQDYDITKKPIMRALFTTGALTTEDTYTVQVWGGITEVSLLNAANKIKVAAADLSQIFLTFKGGDTPAEITLEGTTVALLPTFMATAPFNAEKLTLKTGIKVSDFAHLTTAAKFMSTGQTNSFLDHVIVQDLNGAALYGDPTGANAWKIIGSGTKNITFGNPKFKFPVAIGSATFTGSAQPFTNGKWSSVAGELKCITTDLTPVTNQVITVGAISALPAGVAPITDVTGLFTMEIDSKFTATSATTATFEPAPMPNP